MTAADRKRQQEHIRHWRESAERDLKTAEDLMRVKHYHFALFVCHLAIEKLLKGLVIQSEQTPPFTHELARLWTMAGLEEPAMLFGWLGEIDKFNIAGRYDDEKQTFYRKATKAYATEWFANCREVYTWLEQQFN